MEAKILPIDPMARVVNSVVWKCTAEERRAMDAIFHMDPLARVMSLMGFVTRVAQRDGKVREMLAAPGVLDGLKKMVKERQERQLEISGAPSENEVAHKIG